MTWATTLASLYPSLSSPALDRALPCHNDQMLCNACRLLLEHHIFGHEQPECTLLLLPDNQADDVDTHRQHLRWKLFHQNMRQNARK